MPGIAGVVSSASPEYCRRVVEMMISTMMHEPSYSSGMHLFPEFGIYGGWVAHADSFAAQLSRKRVSSSPVLVFSGEYFAPPVNLQTRAGMDGFNDECPAHVVAEYTQRGDSFIEELNGLFSGLLIDPRRGRALLFNDRYGIERIYFFEKDGATYFASEAKALLGVLPELRAFDDEGVEEFLTYGCTLNGRTLFKKLCFLPGGSLWVFDKYGQITKTRYFQPEQWSSQSELPKQEFETAYLNALKNILPRYLSASSNIGISLTGGLDTRMIMASLTFAAVKPICYTFAGLTGNTLDARLASKVAEACGLKHQTLRVGQDFLQDFGRHVDRTVFVTDGCAGALNAHEIYLNALAHRLSPVRVTGNFGSEVLRGVSTFKRRRVADSLTNGRHRGAIHSVTQISGDENLHPTTLAAFREIPWSLFGSLAAGRSQLSFRTPYLDNELVALAFRAPAGSRNSPCASLRFVNNTNAALARIPTDRGVLFKGGGPSYWLKRVYAEVTFKLDYLHSRGLPNWLSPLDRISPCLSRFGVLGLHDYLPYRIWFRENLAPYIASVLSDPHTRNIPYWDPEVLPRIVSDHVRGRKNYMQEIHAILTLESVDRMLIKGAGKI